MAEVTATSISLDDARRMTQAFRESRGNDPKCTKSVWFPLKQIETMIAFLKQEKADGLRIYFGRYTQTAITNLNAEADKKPVPTTYLDRDTVIFVSTEKNKDPKKPSVDYFHYKGKQEEMKTAKGIVFDPENRGEICPLDCPIGSPMMIDIE